MEKKLPKAEEDVCWGLNIPTLAWILMSDPDKIMIMADRLMEKGYEFNMATLTSVKKVKYYHVQFRKSTKNKLTVKTHMTYGIKTTPLAATIKAAAWAARELEK